MSGTKYAYSHEAPLQENKTPAPRPLHHIAQEWPGDAHVFPAVRRTSTATRRRRRRCRALGRRADSLFLCLPVSYGRDRRQSQLALASVAAKWRSFKAASLSVCAGCVINPDRAMAAAGLPCSALLLKRGSPFPRPPPHVHQRRGRQRNARGDCAFFPGGRSLRPPTPLPSPASLSSPSDRGSPPEGQGRRSGLLPLEKRALGFPHLSDGNLPR